DRAEADSGKCRRLQRVEPHLAQHRRLVALRSAAVHRDCDTAVRRLLPILRHLLQVLVPDGCLGDDGGELDWRLGDREGGHRQEHSDRNEQTQRSRWGGPFRAANRQAGLKGPPYCLIRLADHSICPMPATSALPLTIVSPARSPVIATFIAPCGVCATIVSVMTFPSSDPLRGTSPIGSLEDRKSTRLNSSH